MIGNAHARDDLSARTIDQIYALMDQLREAGRPATAVGRYQIIKQTLRTLQASRLSGSLAGALRRVVGGRVQARRRLCSLRQL